MWGITKEIYDADPSVMSGLEAVKEAKAPIEAILEQPIINGNAKSNEIDQHPVGKTKDGKLYHIVLCMLQEGFTAEIYGRVLRSPQIEQSAQANADKFMKTMVDMEPALTSHGLISCLIGKPLSNAQAHNHLFGFVCELATEEDLNYYLYHKLHIDMIMSNGGVSYDWSEWILASSVRAMLIRLPQTFCGWTSGTRRTSLMQKNASRTRRCLPSQNHIIIDRMLVYVISQCDCRCIYHIFQRILATWGR